jgi:hypothetical protein
MIRTPEEGRCVPRDLSVPGSVLRAISPIRFPVLDEHGADVGPLFVA